MTTFNFSGFGQPAATQPQPAFGATNPAPTFGGFGAPAAAPAAAPTFGGFGFGTQTSTAAPTATQGFTFGATSSAAPTFGAASSAAPTFGAASSAAPTFGFGAQPAASSAAPALAALAATTVTTTTPSLGLGGISSTPFGGELAASNAQGKPDSKALKELAVPAEINQLVEDFKKHVKQQKTMKEEVARGSSQALDKVSQEVDSFRQLLAELSGGIQQHSALLHRLKHDAALEIHNAEIGQRTKETAPSLQLDNAAPVDYFFRLVADFEQRMQFYKQQIDNTEKNLAAMGKQQTLTPRDLMDTMKKLHESFLLLCGRAHVVHTALQNAKEDYLSFRRRVLGDPSDIFAAQRRVGTPVGAGAAAAKAISATPLHARRGVGPSPFGGGTDPLARTMSHLSSGGQHGSADVSLNAGGGASLASRAPGALGANASGLAFGTPGRTTAGAALFGSPFQSAAAGSSLAVDNRSFQLQSPPPGNKRNKR